MPEGSLAQDSDGRNCFEERMMLNPEESKKSEEGEKFNGPAFAEDHECWSCKETNDNEPGVFFEVRSKGLTERASSDGFAEVFIELISLFFILVEKPSLEENGCDNQSFSEDGDKCHDSNVILMERVWFNIQLRYVTMTQLYLLSFGLD